MLKEIVISIQAYFKAHEFISKHKLWKWIIIPGILYAILFMISMYFFGKSATAVITYITIDLGLNNWLQKLQSTWIGFLFTIGSVILWLLLMLLYFSLFKYIWLIIGAPVFSYLSDKTQTIIEGRELEFNLQQFITHVIRGIKMAGRNTLWQTVYLVSIIFLSLLPLIGWATPILAVIVECYYYGFSMLDYPSERMNMGASETIEFIGQHKGLAIGNGMIFYMFHLIPFVGWVFAPAYAVIAGTISMHHIKQRQSNIH